MSSILKAEYTLISLLRAACRASVVEARRSMQTSQECCSSGAIQQVIQQRAIPHTYHRQTSPTDHSCCRRVCNPKALSAQETSVSSDKIKVAVIGIGLMGRYVSDSHQVTLVHTCHCSQEHRSSLVLCGKYTHMTDRYSVGPHHCHALASTPNAG